MKGRYNINLELNVVRTIDKLADEKGISRSAMVGDILLTYIKCNSKNLSSRSDRENFELQGQVKML